MYASILAAAILAALVQEPADGPRAAEAVAALQPSPDWKPLGRSLWFDAKSEPKRLIARARVVLREGPLEHLLCLRGTKEHEAIFATDAPPVQIHAGLILTGAEPGHPVRFRPKFEPPAGTPIRIMVRWMDRGKVVEVDARTLIRDEKAKKPLEVDWVFGGSTIYDDPLTRKKVYAGDEGDLVTVANFVGAILDVPVSSSAEDASRSFVADTDKIPPVGTDVQFVLSPAPSKPR